MILPNLISIAIIKELPFAQKSKQLWEINKSALVVLNVMQARKTIWFFREKKKWPRCCISLFWANENYWAHLLRPQNWTFVAKGGVDVFFISPATKKERFIRGIFFQLGSAQLWSFLLKPMSFLWLDLNWAIAMALKSIKVKLGSAFLETEHFTCSKTVLNRWQGCNECYWSILCVSYKRWTSILNKNAIRAQDGT